MMDGKTQNARALPIDPASPGDPLAEANAELAALPADEYGGEQSPFPPDWAEDPGTQGPSPAAGELAEEAAQAVPKPFGAVQVADYVTLDVKRPGSIVERFAYRGEVVLIIGDPGSGKTLLLNQLAYDVAAGKPFLGMETGDRGAVLFFDLEQMAKFTAGPKGRVAWMLRGQDLEGVPLYIVNQFDREVRDPRERVTFDVKTGPVFGSKLISLDTFEARVAAELDALGIRDSVRAIVVDGFTQFNGGRVDENSAAEVREAIMAFRRLAAKFNVAVILLLHTGKGDALQKTARDMARGSSAFIDSCDAAYTLSPYPKKSDIEARLFVAKLSTAKRRNDALLPDMWLQREGAGEWERLEAEPPNLDGGGEDGGNKGGRPSGYDEGALVEAFPEKTAVLTRKELAANLEKNGYDISDPTLTRWLKTAVEEGKILAGNGRKGYYLLPEGQNMWERQDMLKRERLAADD